MSEILEKKIAVLVSGGGTNLQSLIDKIHNQYGNISLVIADNPEAYGLKRAEKAQIPTKMLEYRAYTDKNTFFEELYAVLDAENPDLIVLAGFLKILTPKFYARFKNRIINIHPSLIPSFCGKGYYGIRVHEAVLAYGAKISGVTVHFADESADTGAIILQRAVAVLDSDSAEDLQKRILVQEHEILPEAVKLFLTGKLIIDGRRVKIIE